MFEQTIVVPHAQNTHPTKIPPALEARKSSNCRQDTTWSNKHEMGV